MNIAVIGTGFVGLVTGASLGALGHKVICVGRSPEKISKINSGKSPFFEPRLGYLLSKLKKDGLLCATNNLSESVLSSDITIIAVGTPTIDDRIDLAQIKKTSQQIGQALKNTNKYHVVVVKSTVVPGTSEDVVKPFIEKYSYKKAGKDFGLCMNPEFLREGNALEDALNPDRIVIGRYDEKSGEELKKLYKKNKCPIIFTNLRTAELTKYASNALLATLISYSNEISRIAEATLGIDVVDVWKGVHLDKRLSPIVGNTRIKPQILSYIFSGCGYGGSCLPKDTKALANFADDLKIKVELIKSVIDINNTQPNRTIALLKNAIGEDLKDKKITVLGLSFKPDTDDLRESAAFPIIRELISEGAKVVCHDPQVYKESVPKVLSDLPISLAKSAEEALQNAEVVIIVTAWDEYKKITPQVFKKYMRNPVVIDGRRIYAKEAFENAGVIYRGIGYLRKLQ